jgi:uncharacterized protein
MTARSDTVAELAPVATHDRIALFDVLRGFCLFGVLWSNLNDWYSVAAPVTSINHAIQWTQIWLVESRFYSMLGFLFGIGFAIQLTRAAERGQDGRNFFLRRMAVLLAFGIVHAFLIWHGDVLIAYAIAGFALVFFRRWSPRHLLIAVPVLSLLLTYAVVHLAAIFNVHLPRWGDNAEQQLDGHALQVYAHGTWAQSIAVGAQQYAGWFVRYLLLEGINSFLALFLLGLWAVRVGLITSLTRRRVYIIGALLGAAVCWAGFRYGQLHLGQWGSAPQVTLSLTWRKLRFWWPPYSVVRTFFLHGVRWANAAVYALIVALAMSFTSIARRLRPLAAVGRMTLTTYLVQSVLSTLVFYNWGFGLMNKINLTGIFLFTVVLFALQIVFSVWWLNRYRFGPAEWLWRSLAYGRMLPLRIATVAPSPTVSAVTA